MAKKGDNLSKTLHLHPNHAGNIRYKAVHRLEEMDEEVHALARGLDLIDKELKTNIPFSVYN